MKSKTGIMLSPAEVDSSLKEFNITVVGSFNAAIIEPGWVTTNKIVEVGEFAILMPPGGQAPFFLAGELGWRVLNDRLVVFGSRDLAPLFVQKVLGILEHTPVSAAGINFQKKEEKTESGSTRSASLNGLLPDLEPIEFSEGRTYQLDDGVKLTVKATWTPDLQCVTANFHKDSRSIDNICEHVARVGEFGATFDSLGEEI